MATITFEPELTFNDLFELPFGPGDTVNAFTDTVFEVEAHGYVLRIEGTGFVYNTAGAPVAGMITGLRLFKNGVEGARVTNMAAGLLLAEADDLRLDGDTAGLFAYLLPSADAATAGVGDQVIQTFGGNDTIDGGAGADTIEAGDGDDIVTAALSQGPEGGATELILGGAGFDRLFIDRSDRSVGLAYDALAPIVMMMLDGTGLSGFEQVQFRSGSGNDVIDGGLVADLIVTAAGNDWIGGRDGDDTLDAGSGQDEVSGGSGNDLIAAGDGLDWLAGDAGADTIDGGAQADHLFGGDDADLLIGGLGADIMDGGFGNDVLDGGPGQDLLAGGAGDDVMIVNDPNDALLELAGDGRDTVFAQGSFTLTAFAEIEWLRPFLATAKVKLNLTGNGFNNTIEGNAGVNILNGKGGKDVLRGGKGRDTFVFDTKLGKDNVDTIADFRVKDDGILLRRSIFEEVHGKHRIVKGSFVSGTKALDEDDRILYNPRTGKLSYDEDGNGRHKAVAFATLPKKLHLTEADFLL